MPFDANDVPDSETEQAKQFTPETANQSPEQNVDTGMMYLHPSSLVFDLLAHGRTYLVPIVLGLFGAANGNVFFLIISGILFIPAVGMSVFRYVTLRYQIYDRNLIVDQGVIFKQTRTVPVSRIQNIDLVQNVLHRLMGVAEVKIETASGTEPEAVLRVLSMTQVDKLRHAIFGRLESSDPIGLDPNQANHGLISEGLHAETEPKSQGQFVAKPAAVETLLTIPVFDLIKAGLSSNRGLIMVGILIGGYFQFGNEYEIHIEEYLWLPDIENSLLWGTMALVGLFVALVLLRFLSAGWFLLRFFGYRLECRGDDLRISCGLLTKVSATIPRKRIQFISVHRHWMMRMFGLCSIRIETAGGSGEQQNASESVSKRWFIPAMK